MNTDYLNLGLTDAAETAMTFLEWRTLINGTGGNSNMQLIDLAIQALNEKVDGKADGFKLDPETGELQLTSGGTNINGAKITIDLNKYYTKEETDDLFEDLSKEVNGALENLADNEALQNISENAVGNLEWDENTRTLTMLNLSGSPVGESITIEGGGGTSGGTGHSVRVINGMSANTLTVASSATTVLKASFYEYFGTETTGIAGTLDIAYKLATEVDWISFGQRTVNQGEVFSIDVTNALTMGKATNVRLTVTGGESGVSRALTYTITQVEASISAVGFDSTAVYTGNVNFQYRCVGRNLSKTVHFILDGAEYAQVDVGASHNTTLTQSLELRGNYSYGAHDLQVYFTTEDGASSNILNYTLLYNDGSDTAPIVGATLEHSEITYGDTINLTYVLYTPGQETTDELNITVYTLDGEDVRTDYYRTRLVDVQNNTAYVWSGTTYPESGAAYIELSSGDTVKTFEIQVNPIQSEYDLNQVETGLVYAYSAAGRSNNDSEKEVYAYEYTTANGVKTQIKGAFSGFNWVSNGYDGTSLTISGDATHVIELPMFSTSYQDDAGQTISLESATGATVVTNGRTFEVEFQVNNVTDMNAKIIRCMSSAHAGFVVTPQNCYLLASNGQDVALDATGFVENEASIATAYIKDGTRIRLSFVIEGLGSTQYVSDDGTNMTGQCVNIYINGEYANSFPYPDNARFTQSEFITMGDPSCIMNVYDVRIYNRGLSATEIMQNYKASPLSVQDRIARFEDNDVLTDDGDVDYEKAKLRYPCLLVTGELSPYKGAKKYGGVILTKPDGNGGFTEEFSLMDQNDSGAYVSYTNVQGTSSVKFPIKNFKVYLVKRNEDGTTSKVKYALKGLDAEGNALSIPESTLCWKGDYMSSDHANTFNANLADTLYQDVTVAQDKEQGGDPRVQNTVYGFRCLLFRRDDVGSVPEFYGDGALNNDKGNNKSFGLECEDDEGNDTKRQKWEFLNNTELLCSFLTDRFNEPVQIEGGTQKRVIQGLECTYPDQGDLEDAGLEPNYDYIQTLFTWVCQRANFWEASTVRLSSPLTYQGKSYNTERDYRKAIFLNEFERHFDKNHTLVYYIFIEFVALCDNRAKNMFMQSLDVKAEQLFGTNGKEMSIQDAINPTTGEVDADMIDWEKSTFAVWMPVLYDLDSCFGVENSGYLQIPYYADWDYYLNGAQKFNGRESVLWLMVEEALADDIKAKVKEMTERTTGGLNYNTLYDVHIKNNALLVCPTVVNRDMEHKYSDPWTEGFTDYSAEGNPVRHISDYKYLQRGSRTQQKDAFIYRRSNMLYSKYQCNKFLNNNINFRVGLSDGLSASQSGITMTSNQVLYPAVKFGDGDAAVIAGAKTAAGTAVTITRPGTSAADRVGYSDTVYICGGTLLTDIGDISKFHPYEMQLQNATGLKKLTIGSSEAGYENSMLGSIDTSNCKLLEELNICGCTALDTIDLSKNGLIRKVYAQNSSASSIILPNGGVLTELHLGTVADLQVLNHTGLEEFSCDSYDRLTALHIENTPNIPVLDIVEERLTQLTDGLRLVGIDATIDDTTILERLVSGEAQGKYIDANGNLSEDKSAYPYISGTIHCATIGSYLLGQLNSIYPYLVIDAASTVTQYVVQFKNYDGSILDTQYVFRGESAVDPVTREQDPIPVPTQPSTASTDYTYEKWDIGFSTITADTIVRAVYTEKTREYTVRWYNGSALLQETTVLYGQAAEYEGETPEDTSQEAHVIYRLFDKWDKFTGFVSCDLDVHAQFTEATPPTDKKLAEMNPTELYALVKSGVLSPTGSENTVITSGDEFDLILGHDCDFDNVESHEFISPDKPMVFDGTNYLNTGMKILADDTQSFVLAVDFAWGDSPSSGEALMGCYEKSTGVLLRYQNYPMVRWCAANYVRASTGSYREIVVIRKVAGDPNLYVYASDKMSDEMIETVLTNSVSACIDAPLSFGANVQSDGYVDNYAKGTVYWAKLWMADLGAQTCRHLASFPRQTITMQAAGFGERNFRVFVRSDNGRYCNCCFLMKDLLDRPHVMNTTYTNAGGWRDSAMRAWLNSRVYDALPEQWKLLIPLVRVSSGSGGSDTSAVTLVTSDDHLFLPSIQEVFADYSDSALSQESEGTFNFYTTNGSRVKHYGNGNGAAAVWSTRSPMLGYSAYFCTVSASGGGLAYTSPNSAYGVCFGFCI